MARQETGLNLLFGVIALQLDLINAQQFAEACSTWAARKEITLDGLLVERGWISAEDRAEINRIVQRKMAHHGGDSCDSLNDAMNHSVGTLVSSIIIADESEAGLECGATADAVDPAAETVDAPVAAGGRSGTRGRFQLVRMYAKGGLGQVWLARDPVLGRDVALKELKPDKATDPASRARFLREARITGRLEHPGIVTVHELAGRDDDRRAFYAMQLLRGRTLREAIRDYHKQYGNCPGGVLELHALLEDFIAVCNAVAYAHSRGVIHRDLKGQNIVLGDFGEVVVLDWGLAKVVGEPETPAAKKSALGERLDDSDAADALTLEGQRMGTPGFMAPEQAEGRQDLIGIGSDIYGLGAILYEILTGMPPFADSKVTEFLKRVSHEDPIPPRQICSDIPIPLEAICLKALSKRPADRYSRATDMAQDVRRWLADEPISVHRESLAERMRRWGRRHRSAVTVGTVLLTIIFAGLILVLFVGTREQARTRRALASEARHRRRAETNLAFAREAVDNLYAKVLENPLLAEPAMDPLRVSLIRTTRDYYEKLVSLAPTDADLLEHLTGIYLNVSRITLRSGAVGQAIEEIKLALGISEDLAATYPKIERYRSHIAMCQLELAECYRDGSRPDDSEIAYQHAVAVWSRLARETRSPTYALTLAVTYDCLGSLYRSLGRLDPAATAHRDSLAILQKLLHDSPPGIDRQRTLDRIASCFKGLAYIAKNKGDWAEAESQFQQAYDTWTRLQVAHPSESTRSELATLLGGWAEARAASGRIAEARAMRERSMETWSTLMKEHPTTVQYRDCVANDHIHIGELFEREGRRADAARHYEAALTAWKNLSSYHAERPALAFNEAKALYHLARLHASGGQRIEAVRNYRSAKTIWDRLGGKLHEDYERAYRNDLARALAELRADRL